jgi:hypothetical protein
MSDGEDSIDSVHPECGGRGQNYQPFPVDALPPVMAQFADDLGRSLCVDPAMAALPMLSIAGAAIGNTARARMSPDYHAPPNVWTAPVVLSGDRKSPVLRAVMQPVYGRQQEAAEQYAHVVAEYKADLDRWKNLTAKERRATDKPMEPGPYPHLYLSDTTTEAIALRLAQQPRGLAVVHDELAAFFSGMNQYRPKGGNDRETYLAFYDAGTAKVDRKSATPPTIFIRRAFVSVTGMIQPGALGRALGPADFDSGLAARFLLAAPESKQATWNAGGIANSAREGWSTLLATMLDAPLPEQPAPIPPSDAAMRLWAKAHDHLEQQRFAEPDDRMRAARAKLIGVIPRLSLIFQCVSSASGEGSASVRFIDEVSMTRAIVLAEWFTNEAKRVYCLLADEDSEEDILARIERNGSVTPRELMRWSRAQFRTVALAESFLESLVHEGVGRWEWRHTRGRPSRAFTLLHRGDGDKTPIGAGESGGSVTVTNGNGKNGESCLSEKGRAR